MTRPLYRAAARHPERRPPDGHAGLWFDKYCDRWRVDYQSADSAGNGPVWTMASGKDGDGTRSGGCSPTSSGRKEGSPKLEWLGTLTRGKVGTADQLDEYTLRLARLVMGRGGRSVVFRTESRFVTGLGRSHPIENGFAWHSTLGTPCLPGSSIKGTVGAWAKRDADPLVPQEMIRRLLGDHESAGRICFLDAVPVVPVQLEPDVMTPHHVDWTPGNPPGDWRSPTPIPFLVTAAGTPFLFSLLPCAAVRDSDLDAVMSWLISALAWSGVGAKTAVGYGRFARDDSRTDEIHRRLRDLEREREVQREEATRAAKREAARAAMSLVEREIANLLEARLNENESEVATIFRAINGARWTGEERIEAAGWLERRMKASNDKNLKWKEESSARKPEKDKAYQRTLQVKCWLKGE